MKRREQNKKIDFLITFYETYGKKSVIGVRDIWG